MPPINFYYYGFVINRRRFFTKQMSRLMKKPPLKAIRMTRDWFRAASDEQKLQFATYDTPQCAIMGILLT